MAEAWRSLLAWPATTLRALADSAEEALFVLDERGAIRAANCAAEEICSQLPVFGKRLSEVLPAPELAELVDEMLRMDEPEQIEQISIDERPYRARLRRLPGRRRWIGVSLQDISELVRLNRARRDMVANISHELRTPISNILIIIESLFHEKERPKRQASISSLRAIRRETDSLQHLAEELLTLSMMETGQILMRLQPVALRPLVREIEERQEERRSQNQVAIHNQVPENMSVLADADQLRRVLTNLLQNALKWTPSGGAIHLSATPSEEGFRISVRDTGPGIPPDQTKRIFERFYQLDASRSHSEGIGLGLAICQHIVEAHGGRIWAENAEGGGSIFHFTLLSA